MDKIDPPIRATALSRQFNKKKLGEDKADIWICGDVNFGFSKITKCSECGKSCYYSEDCLDLIKKKANKICLDCALKNHRESLDEDSIRVLEKTRGDFSEYYL